MKIPSDLLALLREEDDFFIATHVNPEGDALGSSIALSMALHALGKHTVIFDKDGVPDLYRFLPGCEQVKDSLTGVNPSDFTLLLLDCNTLERAGIEGLTFKKTAVIDHHETETALGDVRWIEPHAAATGMMVFSLVRELGVRITEAMAVNLYTAIAIDTGTFRFDNTNADVLRTAAELADAGARPSVVSANLYERWTQARFNLLRLALQTFEIRGDIAFTFVTRDMFTKTGAGPEDTENFSSFPRIIKDVKVSAFFREIEHDYWKVSLRSKGDINVATIAACFQGGGHKNAAGYYVRAPIEAAKESLAAALSASTVPASSCQ